MTINWITIRKGIDARLIPLGFSRINQEALRISVNETCRGYVSISSRDRISNASERTFDVGLGVAYPILSPIYDDLWGIEGRTDDMEFCPLSCNLWQVSNTFSRIRPRISAENLSDQLDIFELTIQRDVLVEFSKLSSLAYVREVLENRFESPWFDVGAMENFLPIVLIAEGRLPEALNLADSALSSIVNRKANSVRIEAYRAFVERIRALKSCSQVPGSD